MNLGTQMLRVERHGDVSVATLDSPPVNALSTRLRGALLAAIKAVNKDGEAKVLVLAGAGRGFSGGADIKEFASRRKHRACTTSSTRSRARPSRWSRRSTA